MEVVKVLNNSTAIASEMGTEVVVMGKGLAFGKKNGDTINEDMIEKKFSLDNLGNSQKLAKLLSSVSIQYFEIAKDIIDIASSELNETFNDSIYLTLTDHISFAIERHQVGTLVPNALLNEIKNLYQKEYQIGLDAIQYIALQTNVQLPIDEAGFIALHIVNASNFKESQNQTNNMTVIVNEIIDIIQTYFKMTLEEDSLNYSRLITHLKYFSLRILNKEDSGLLEPFLPDMIKEKYPHAYGVIPIISTYLNDKWHYSMGESEAVYLTVHIQRVLLRG